MRLTNVSAWPTNTVRSAVYTERHHAKESKMHEAIHVLRALRLADHAAALDLDKRLQTNAGSFDSENYTGAEECAVLNMPEPERGTLVPDV